MPASPTSSADCSTVFALATSSQASPTALIRISGPHCQAVCLALLRAPFGFGVVAAPMFSALGEVPCRGWLLPGPHTLTGEDSIELLIPGNPRVVAAIELRLLELGCRQAEPGEFTRRALNAGKLDLSRAEAVCALINSHSQAQRRAALIELSGESARELSRLTETLRQLSARYEVAFDFSEDEPDSPPFEALHAAFSSLALDLGRFCSSRPHNAPRPVPVIALFGPPNAGKSSLFNRLLKSSLALVSDLPGTTRDPVRATVEFAGHKVDLLDLSGVGASDSDGGRFAETARREAVQADLLLALCAPGQDSELAVEHELLCKRDPELALRTLWVHTMADQRNAAQYQGCLPHGVWVSIRSGEGIDNLQDQLAKALSALFASHPSSHQRQAVVDAAGIMAAASKGLGKDPPEFTAGQLRVSLRMLDEALLAQTPGEVLDSIFSRFCIGK